MYSIVDEPPVRVLVIGRVWEGLSVSKREAQKFYIETSILKKLNNAEI